MDLNNQFEISTGLEQAWKILLDVPRIVPLVPGAELTEMIDDTHFKGMASIKVGPISLKFTGNAEFVDIDHNAHTATIKANGADNKGRGQAQADVVFSLEAIDDDHTSVNVDTNLNLTGTVAQYGRATGLIDEVAKQLIGQFVQNLESELKPDTVAPGLVSTPATGENIAMEKTVGPAPAVKPISGISLMLKAIGAMIKRWFGGS